MMYFEIADHYEASREARRLASFLSCRGKYYHVKGSFIQLERLF